MKYVLFVCNHNAGRSQMGLVRARCARWRAAEFDARRSADEIRACADAVVNRFDDVPVRSFVITLAHRRPRQCPAAETCDAPAVMP